MTYKLVFYNIKYNKLFGLDPTPNKKKQLIIYYTDINNINKKFITTENNNFSLTSINSINYASYGIGNKNVDVTVILNKLLIFTGVKDLQRELNIIITASYIKSHPSIKIIENTIQSLNYLKLPQNTKIIIANDYSEEKNFKKYLLNLNNYLNNINIQNVSSIKCIISSKWGHLTGNIRNAFTFVDGKYLLFVQHDFPFCKNIDICSIIQDMKNNIFLKHIRFNKRSNIKCGWDAQNNLFGDIIQSDKNNYIRTGSWSDNNHITNYDYYNSIVLNECRDRKPMEKQLNKKIFNEKTHNKYGTYIYGNLNDSKAINHIDGKRTR
jgi:hypothetical protein